ncbi:MAG: DUF5990 family protein [Dehalococcoidia bacterium]
MSAFTVRIVGRNLPGRRFGDCEPVYLGIQRAREVVDLAPGDADAAVFDFSVDVVLDTVGGVDFRGPYVHGRRGERFIHLSWGELKADAGFAMFRRAKLHLSALDRQDVERVLMPGALLEATLELTDARGGPVCASLRPPQVRWQATAGPCAPADAHEAAL